MTATRKRKRGRRGRGEGTISLRNDGRWQARVYLDRGEDGKRRYKVAYAPTREEAGRRLNELLGRSVKGELLTTTTPTLRDWLSTWYAAHRSDWRGSTGRIYRTAIDEWIVPALGSMRLEKLSPAQIQRWVNAATKDGARAKVVLAHVVLRSALKFAMTQRLVTFNAASLVRVPRPERKPIVVLNAEQAGSLMKAAEEHRLGALVTMTLALGLRIGEVSGITWTDVNLDERTVQIGLQLQQVRDDKATKGSPQTLKLTPLKTKASRRKLSLPSVVVDALKAHRTRQREERMRSADVWKNAHDLVFTRPDGQPLQPGQVRHVFCKMLRAANLPTATKFHSLRHSNAVLLLLNGAALGDVSKALGHAGIQITADTYSHFTPEVAESVALRMDSVLKTGSKA
jgi:integrase